MKFSLAGWALLGVSVLLHVAALAALVAMLQALSVSSTIAAVESAFGSLVLGLLLLLFARQSWRAAKSRRKSSD